MKITKAPTTRNLVDHLFQGYLFTALLAGLTLLICCGCQTGGTEKCPLKEIRVKDPSDNKDYTYVRCSDDHLCSKLLEKCTLQRRQRTAPGGDWGEWEDVPDRSFEVLPGQGTNRWAWKNPKFQWQCVCK